MKRCLRVGDGEIGRHVDSVAQRLQRRAVSLRATQHTTRPLRVNPLFELHPRPHPDPRGAHRHLAIDAHRAPEIPVDVHLHLHRLELDPHVRRHRPQGALLADRQRGGQDVARARGVAGAARGGVEAGADNDLRCSTGATAQWRGSARSDATLRAEVVTRAVAGSDR